MARIATYDRQKSDVIAPQRAPVALGQTAKLSGSDPMASALSNAGKVVGNIGQVVNQYENVINKGALADGENGYNIALNQFENNWAETKGASVEGKREAFDDWMSSFTEDQVGSMKGSERTKQVFKTWAESQSEVFGAKIDSSVRVHEIKKAAYSIQTSADDKQKKGILAQAAGNEELANQYFTEAESGYRELATWLGQDSADELISKGRYDGYVMSIGNSLTEQSVESTEERIKKDKYIQPEQLASLLKNTDSQKKSIRQNEVRQVNQLKTNQNNNFTTLKSEYDIGQVKTDSEIDALVEGETLSVYHGNYMKLLNKKKLAGVPTALESAEFSMVMSDIDSGKITSYADIHKRSENMTWKQTKDAEAKFSSKVQGMFGTSTTATPSFWGRTKTIDVYKEFANVMETVSGEEFTASDLDDVYDSVNAMNIPIEQKQTFYRMISAQFASNKNPGMSLAFKTGVAEVLEIERYLASTNENIVPGTFASMMEGAQTPEEVAEIVEKIKEGAKPMLTEAVRKQLYDTPIGNFKPTQIKGDADYNLLESGTLFIDPEGNERIKP